MSPKMAEYFDLTQPDLEPDPHQVPYSVDDWEEAFVTDTEGSGETKKVTGATLEIMMEETTKMCAVAANWKIQFSQLLQARHDFYLRAGVLRSELDHLGGGHGQEDVPRLHRCFDSLLQQFKLLNQHVNDPNSLDHTRILKRKASDTPSPEIKVQSSSSASSHVLKRASSSLFSDESGATAAAVTAMTEAAAKVAPDAEKAEKAMQAKTANTKSSCGFGSGALVAVAASADKRAKKPDECYESDENVVARKPMNVMEAVVEFPLPPLPEDHELAVCERCGCPDAVPLGARICLNCTVAKLSPGT